MKKFVIVEKLGKEELIEDILAGRERAEDKKKEEKPQKKETKKTDDNKE